MLVITRKKGEAVVIGDEITVTVVEIRGDKVRLGFQQPRALSLHRLEVYEAIRSQLQPRREPEAPVASADVTTPSAPRTSEPDDRVILNDRQVAAIDRFRESVRAGCGAELSREEAIEMILTTFEEAGRNLPTFVYGAIRRLGQGPRP